MDAVVEGIEVVLLGNLGSLELVGGSSLLSSHTHLDVGLGVVEDALAEELTIACSVASLLVSVVLEGAGNLGIALTIGLASHSEVHTDLTALTGES